MSGLDASAIVATADRPDWLAKCLASLEAAWPPFRDVIVADQSSGPESRAVAESSSARYLHLDQRGLSRARNAALGMATGEWVYFPDDDCSVAAELLTVVEGGWVRQPGAGFLCAHIEVPGGRPIMAGMDGCERELKGPVDVLRAAMSPGLFVHRRVLDRVGGFDERFGIGARFPSAEESDLLFRALAAGETGRYLPGARVFHPDQFAIRDPESQRRRAFEYGRGWGALFAKHSNGPLRAEMRAIHRHYLVRALGGAALAAFSGQIELARRYGASWRGRRQGYREYQVES